jgi:hypothetical protein
MHPTTPADWRLYPDASGGYSRRAKKAAQRLTAALGKAKAELDWWASTGFENIPKLSMKGRLEQMGIWLRGAWRQSKVEKIQRTYSDVGTDSAVGELFYGILLTHLKTAIQKVHPRIRLAAKFDVFDHDALVQKMKDMGHPMAHAEKYHLKQVKEHARGSKFVFRSKAMENIWNEAISGQISDGIWGGPGGGWWRLYWAWIPTSTGGGTTVQGTATTTEDDVRAMLVEIKGAMDDVKKDPLRAPDPPKGQEPKTDIEKIEHELRWKFGLKDATMVFSQILVGLYGRRTSQYHFFAIYEDHDTGEFVGGNAYGTFGKAPKSVQLARDADIKKVKKKVQRKINKKMGDYGPKDDLLPNKWKTRGWRWGSAETRRKLIRMAYNNPARRAEVLALLKKRGW